MCVDWCVVSDVWYVVCGVWCVVCGVWRVVWCGGCWFGFLVWGEGPTCVPSELAVAQQRQRDAMQLRCSVACVQAYVVLCARLWSVAARFCKCLRLYSPVCCVQFHVSLRCVLGTAACYINQLELECVRPPQLALYHRGCVRQTQEVCLCLAHLLCFLITRLGAYTRRCRLSVRCFFAPHHFGSAQG